jgi:hypothetical protein
MPTLTPYRAMAAEARVALLERLMQAAPAYRSVFVQRIVEKGRGFRAATVAKWPPAQLAREVVRMKAETPQDEFDMLLALYVELDPAVQITFLDAAGVKHEGGKIDEELDPPYADAEGVRRGVEAVRAAHGDAGAHYLMTIAYYSRDGWPGIDTLVAPPA